MVSALGKELTGIISSMTEKLRILSGMTLVRIMYIMLN